MLRESGSLTACSENLRFLSSKQALEDLALLHQHISCDHPPFMPLTHTVSSGLRNLTAANQWVTFGGRCATWR